MLLSWPYTKNIKSCFFYKIWDHTKTLRLTMLLDALLYFVLLLIVVSIWWFSVQISVVVVTNSFSLFIYIRFYMIYSIKDFFPFLFSPQMLWFIHCTDYLCWYFDVVWAWTSPFFSRVKYCLTCQLLLSLICHCFIYFTIKVAQEPSQVRTCNMFSTAGRSVGGGYKINFRNFTWFIRL